MIVLYKDNLNIYFKNFFFFKKKISKSNQVILFFYITKIIKNYKVWMETKLNLI